MNYCENCQVATDLPRCPCCGGKKLREAKSEDYCLLIEKKAMDGEMLADVLRGNGIDCVAMPSGSGVRTAFAAPLENRKLFVPWRSLEQAKAYLREAADAETEKWRQYLLENADKLHIPPKLEKKVVKKSKGACGEDVAEFFRRFIASAERIKDGGMRRIGDNFELFCYSNGDTVIIDGKTLKILSVSFQKR